MARDFDGASDYLERTSIGVSGPPLTLACWFNADTVTANHALVTLSDNSLDAFSMIARGNVDDAIQALSLEGGSSDFAVTTSTYSADTWHHAAAVFTSSTSRDAFLDGGSKGSDTASSAPSGIDRVVIGRAIPASESCAQ